MAHCDTCIDQSCEGPAAALARAQGELVDLRPELDAMQLMLTQVGRERDAMQVEVDHLQAWVHDLLSGMYVNCVYCGHRYGPSPDTPVSMADALKAHIVVCPRHPLAQLRAAVQGVVERMEDDLRRHGGVAARESTLREAIDVLGEAVE